MNKDLEGTGGIATLRRATIPPTLSYAQCGGDGRKAVKQIGGHVRKGFESQNENIYFNLVGTGE